MARSKQTSATSAPTGPRPTIRKIPIPTYLPSASSPPNLEPTSLLDMQPDIAEHQPDASDDDMTQVFPAQVDVTEMAADEIPAAESARQTSLNKLFGTMDKDLLQRFAELDHGVISDIIAKLDHGVISNMIDALTTAHIDNLLSAVALDGFILRLAPEVAAKLLARSSIEVFAHTWKCFDDDDWPLRLVKFSNTDLALILLRLAECE
jgi:hypothetical protein